MCCEGALQIQRLEGSRPGGLWGLYLDEPVLIVREIDVAVGALWFQLLMAERMVMRRLGSDEAEIGVGVARRRGARQPAWYRRRADSSMLSEWGAYSAKRHILSADRMAGATGNKGEGVLLAAC